MIEHIFALYLVLADKKRTDEENLVMKFYNLESCENHASALNELYKENSKLDNKIYVCRDYNEKNT